MGLLAGGAGSARAGWLNSDSLPEVIKPKDAEIDSDLARSSEVRFVVCVWVGVWMWEGTKGE